MASRLINNLKRLVPQDSDALLISKVEKYTLSDSPRLKNLIQLSRQLNEQNVPGDFVECGVCNGGSAAILSRYLNQSRHLWLYDSFEGMPETVEQDGDEAKKWVGTCVGQVENVRAAMNLVSTSDSRYTIKKGWFEHTLCEELPKQVALLHCDADWYNSVALVLETFYPLIPAGGCVILDDFGYWEGCREAFYDFCYRHGEKPLLERVGETQAFWIKGKLNSRNDE